MIHVIIIVFMIVGFFIFGWQRVANWVFGGIGLIVVILLFETFGGGIGQSMAPKQNDLWAGAAIPTTDGSPKPPPSTDASYPVTWPSATKDTRK
jgi:hypothetical protein